jgi:short-subunit dehydrogenase
MDWPQAAHVCCLSSLKSTARYSGRPIVAAAGYRGLMEGHRTVVPGFINKLITILIRIIPRRLVLRVVDSRQSRRRSAQQT